MAAVDTHFADRARLPVAATSLKTGEIPIEGAQACDIRNRWAVTLAAAVASAGSAVNQKTSPSRPNSTWAGRSIRRGPATKASLSLRWYAGSLVQRVPASRPR